MSVDYFLRKIYEPNMDIYAKNASIEVEYFLTQKCIIFYLIFRPNVRLRTQYLFVQKNRQLLFNSYAKNASFNLLVPFR